MGVEQVAHRHVWTNSGQGGTQVPDAQILPEQQVKREGQVDLGGRESRMRATGCGHGCQTAAGVDQAIWKMS